MKTRVTLLLGSITLLTASQLTAQLYQDQMNNAAGWGVNATGSDYAATFNYDYSANGIPEAPNSQGGDVATRGVKLEANLTSGTSQAFTLYPTGQNFVGSYQLRFDAWMSWDINAGFAGTTEFLGGGIGYDNVTADVASGAQAIATGDGGSGSDWRAFKSPPQFFIAGADMTGGTRQGSDPYYADFLPAVSGGVAGSPGFQWITWEFNVVGNAVSVFIEKPDASRLEIVSYDKTDTSDGSSGVGTDGNISLFYADFFSSVSSRPDLTFGLIDNVVVSAIPEPTTGALILLGSAGLCFLSRRRK